MTKCPTRWPRPRPSRSAPSSRSPRSAGRRSPRSPASACVRSSTGLRSTPPPRSMRRPRGARAAAALHPAPGELSEPGHAPARWSGRVSVPQARSDGPHLVGHRRGDPVPAVGDAGATRAESWREVSRRVLGRPWLARPHRPDPADVPGSGAFPVTDVRPRSPLGVGVFCSSRNLRGVTFVRLHARFALLEPLSPRIHAPTELRNHVSCFLSASAPVLRSVIDGDRTPSGVARVKQAFVTGGSGFLAT
jgi:hypothetical protein